MKKKYLAYVLSAAMLTSMMPATSVYAEVMDEPVVYSAAEKTTKASINVGAHTIDAAPLHDTAGAIQDKDLYDAGSYNVTQDSVAGAGTATDPYNIKIAVTGLKKHMNNANPQERGAWVGMSVVAPSGASHMKYVIGDTQLSASDLKGGSGEKVIAVENAVSGSQNGIAFYFDKATSKDIVYAAVQWYSDENTTLADVQPIFFKIDLTGVKVAQDPVAQQLAGTLSISGIQGDAPKVGDTLTANLSAVKPDGILESDLNFQWCRGEQPIDTAKDKAYTVVKEDVNKTLKVKIIPKATDKYTGELVSAETEAVVDQQKTVVEAPTFTPNGGELATDGTIRIQSATQDAKIYYTTGDEDLNTEAGTEYIDELKASDLFVGDKTTVTIKAIAKDETGKNKSSITTATFKKKAVVPETEISSVEVEDFTPVAGNTSKDNITVKTEAVTGAVTWQDTTADSPVNPVVDFKAGHTYKAIVTLTSTGKNFADTKIPVTGITDKTVNATRTSGNNQEATFTIDFALVATQDNPGLLKQVSR